MDAEQTYYQPAIRNFIVHCMMKRYNKEKPVLYDTVQSYLKVSVCVCAVLQLNQFPYKSTRISKISQCIFMDLTDSMVLLYQWCVSLQSSHQTILSSHLSTQRNNCIYAVKVVRGAYMDEERRLAIQHEYEGVCIQCVVHVCASMQALYYRAHSVYYTLGHAKEQGPTWTVEVVKVNTGGGLAFYLGGYFYCVTKV